MTTYIPTIQYKSSSSATHSYFTLMLPFILPKALPLPVSGKIVFLLQYKFKQIAEAIGRIYLQTRVPVMLDTPYNLENYTFIMYDTSCGGKVNEYVINFSRA